MLLVLVFGTGLGLDLEHGAFGYLKCFPMDDVITTIMAAFFERLIKMLRSGKRKDEVGVPFSTSDDDGVGITRSDIVAASLGTALEFETITRLQKVYTDEETNVSDRPRLPPLGVTRRTNALTRVALPASISVAAAKTSSQPVLSTSASAMHVVKRDGRREAVSFDKITARLRQLAENPFSGYAASTWRYPQVVVVDDDPHVTGGALSHADPVRVSQKVCNAIYDGVSTEELDELSAETSISMATMHPDYGVLASRIAVSNMHKTTPATLKESFLRIGKERIAADVFEAVVSSGDVSRRIENALDYTKDYQCDYFAIKTLTRVYLLTDSAGKVAERPQHMWMRVALGIHGPHNIPLVLETYKLMSERYFTHATPTLFNSGTRMPQNSSCYLTGITRPVDSIDGIYNAIKNCALISKYGGGIGIHIHDVRAKGSKIKGTNGTSTGIVPMLKVFNDTARYVNQCCTPETVVFCKEGPKAIKDVAVGDHVVTRDGSYRAVVHVFQNDVVDEPMISISVKDSVYDSSWTRSHRILIRRENTVEYVNASDIRVGDFMVFPVPSFCDDYRRENVDLQMCRFVGICVVAAFDNVDVNNCSGSTVQFMRSFINERKLVNLGHIDLSKFMHRPIEEIGEIIRGILEVSGESSDTCYVFRTSSSELAMSLRYMFLRLKVATSGSVRDDGTVEIVIPRHPNLASYLPDGNVLPRDDDDDGGVLYSEVTAVRKRVYSGKIYDLNIEENHNYMTESGLVHNSGKRKGSIAVYLEPWHADIFAFLDLRRNHGLEEDRARDLFLAVWVPDLFMKRVENDEQWSLFCPNTAPGLSDVYGEEFDRLYTSYEADTTKIYQKVAARSIWNAILTSQVETGVPYILFKDACNLKSNQKNIGVIKSSNLCTEIMEVSNEKECAVCNLASISLPKYVRRSFIDESRYYFDFPDMMKVVKVMVRNLNRVIDVSFYPIPEAKASNMAHRPIGIGVQGLADVFAIMNMPFDSKDAKDLNAKIFESIYYAAVEASVELAAEDGAYSSFDGSPASQGLLQFDLWGFEPPEGRYDWAALKAKVKETGLRNSLLVAPMPTASTAQILGNNEAFEPFSSNLYVRKTLAGEFVIINKHLVKDLIRLGLWNVEMKDAIIRSRGSVQTIPNVPDDIKSIYKTAYELRQRSVIDMAADRGVYVCQSQSLNLFMGQPAFASMTSMYFYAWKKGLKTGCYYLRSLPASDPIAVTVLRSSADKGSDKVGDGGDGEDNCIMCSA